MGKWQRRGPRPSPLAETIPSVQLEGGGSLFSPKNFSVTPQALTIKHTDFSMLSTSWRSLGHFFELCGEHGLDASFPSQWNFVSTPQSHLRGASSQKTASCREQDGSDSAACVHPSSYFSSKVDIRALSAPPQSLSASDQQEPMFACLHIKALT